MFKKILLQSGTILLLIVFSSYAGVPQLINYQCYLTDPAGTPLSGPYSIEFMIYQKETGGSPLWSEVQIDTVKEGYLSTMLGSVNPIPYDLFNGSDLYLTLKIENDLEMKPRKQLVSVGYAFRANNADSLGGKAASDFVDAGSVNIVSSVDGVVNHGGDIDLVEGSNITITPDDAANTITISAVGGGGGDITAVHAGDGLMGGAESDEATLDVNVGDGLTIESDVVQVDQTVVDTWYVNEGQANSVTADMVTPNVLSSLDGVANDGGNVDLVEGSNITITPDDAANTITIAAAGGTGGDDLGNHIATENIQLNGHWLSNDGGDEGIYMSNSGKVGIGKSPFGETLDVLGTIHSSEGITTESYIDAYDLIMSTGRGDTYANIGTAANGVFGEHTGSGNYGRLGSNDCGAFAMHTSSGNYGYLGSSSYGAYGRYGSSGPYGSLGSTSYGVYGKHGSNNEGYIGGSSYGVYGENSSGSLGFIGGSSYGVYGYGSSNGVRGYSTSYAGYFIGDVKVLGDFTVSGTKSFVIDHPLDPGNKYLYHFCVESDELANVYTGNVVLDVSGEATVILPEWFEALNGDFRYQLTCIGGFAQVYIAEEIAGNQFKIAGGDPGMKVSWHVTGIRQDAWAEAHPVQTEVDKKAKDRGKYLHPEEQGLSEAQGMDYEEQRQIEADIRKMEEENAWMEEELIKIDEERQRVEEENRRIKQELSQ